MKTLMTTNNSLSSVENLLYLKKRTGTNIK